MNRFGPRTWISPTVSPSYPATSVPSSSTSRSSTPGSGTPTVPVPAGPSARTLVFISVSVMP